MVWSECDASLYMIEMQENWVLNADVAGGWCCALLQWGIHSKNGHWGGRDKYID